MMVILNYYWIGSKRYVFTKTERDIDENFYILVLVCKGSTCYKTLAAELKSNFWENFDILFLWFWLTKLLFLEEIRVLSHNSLNSITCLSIIWYRLLTKMVTTLYFVFTNAWEYLKSCIYCQESIKYSFFKVQ